MPARVVRGSDACVRGVWFRSDACQSCHLLLSDENRLNSFLSRRREERGGGRRGLMRAGAVVAGIGPGGPAAAAVAAVSQRRRRCALG